ncbi:MAG: LemA family protein [Proteobacteria bacterium]|nr:LemA family protein [Pseudomonadota bacterium]
MNAILMNLNLIILIAVLAIFYFWYASIIGKRNKVLEALSGIDVQLKNRLDLIPNILTIAKKFMEHEKNIFEEVTALREQLGKSYDLKNPQDVKSYLASSEMLAQKMSGIMLRAENYPELKSNQNMLHAQQSYNEIEAQVAAARRFYNSAVTALRNSIQIFPGNILAMLVGVKEMPFFEAEEVVKDLVDAAKFL